MCPDREAEEGPEDHLTMASVVAVGRDLTKEEEGVEAVRQKRASREVVAAGHRWKMGRSVQVFDLSVRGEALEQMVDYVGLEVAAAAEDLQTMKEAHSGSLEAAAVEPQRLGVLHARAKCPLVAVLVKTADGCVLEAAVEHQMAYAPLGKEVVHQTLVSIPFRPPLAFSEAWVGEEVPGSPHWKLRVAVLEVLG